MTSLWSGDRQTLTAASERLASMLPLDGIHPSLPSFVKIYVAQRVASRYVERKADFECAFESSDVLEGLAARAAANGEHVYTLMYGMPKHVADSFLIGDMAELMFVCQLGDIDEHILTTLREGLVDDDGPMSAVIFTEGTYARVPTEFEARSLLCSRIIGHALAYPMLRAGVTHRHLFAVHPEHLAACTVLGVHPDYAVAALRLGLDPDAALMYYREGIPAEYLPELTEGGQ
jgi:hypothetical protein